MCDVRFQMFKWIFGNDSFKITFLNDNSHNIQYTYIYNFTLVKLEEKSLFKVSLYL